MANTTQIHITVYDNELYIAASTTAGSSELCYLKSGFGHILQSGSYELTLVGINWGGPWKFAVTTTPPIPGLSRVRVGSGRRCLDKNGSDHRLTVNT